MILIISGTNRRNNKTVLVAKLYEALVTDAGETSKVLSLENLPDAFLHPDIYDASHHEIENIESEYLNPATKFIFIVPEYHGDYPGILKLFLDVVNVKSGFQNKRAALVGLSDGRHGNVRGLDSLTGVLHHLNVAVLPFKVNISGLNKELDELGNIKSEATLNRMKNQVKQLIAF